MMGAWEKEMVARKEAMIASGEGYQLMGEVYAADVERQIEGVKLNLKSQRNELRATIRKAEHDAQQGYYLTCHIQLAEASTLCRAQSELLDRLGQRKREYDMLVAAEARLAERDA